MTYDRTDHGKTEHAISKQTDFPNQLSTRTTAERIPHIEKYKASKGHSRISGCDFVVGGHLKWQSFKKHLKIYLLIKDSQSSNNHYSRWRENTRYELPINQRVFHISLLLFNDVIIYRLNSQTKKTSLNEINVLYLCAGGPSIKLKDWIRIIVNTNP